MTNNFYTRQSFTRSRKRRKGFPSQSGLKIGLRIVQSTEKKNY
jgi:hypothetical protein